MELQRGQYWLKAEQIIRVEKRPVSTRFYLKYGYEKYDRI